MANPYDEQLFLGYVEGDLAPPEKARFEKMMAEDKKLSSLVAQMLDDRRRLRRMPRDNPPADLMDQATGRLERNMLLDAPPPELNPVTPPQWFRNTRVLAYTGLAAMVLISTAVVMRTLVDRKLYDQDQFAVTGDSDQALAKKDSSAEPSRSLLPPGPSVGLRTETFALKEELDSIEGRLQISPPLAVEPQSFALALGKSKVSQKQSLEENTAQAKAGQSLAIAQSKNAQSFEHHLLSTSRTRQTRASDTAETFARLTPPAAPLEEVQDEPQQPQQAPGDLAQKIMRHLALVDGKLHATDIALDEEKEEEEKDPQLAGSYRDDHVQADAFQTSLGDAIQWPAQPMQIKALAPDITAAQQALLGWAVTHQIQIVRLAPSDANQPTADWDASSPSLSPSRSNQIVLTMPAGDIPRLLEHLNTKPGQSARLVAQPQFWNGAKRQTPSVQLANKPARIDPPAATDSPKGFALDRQSPWRATESDNEKNYPQLPVIAELDWGQLLLPRLPFRPVVPIYAPDTPVHVTVHIYKQSGPVGDE